MRGLAAGFPEWLAALEDLTVVPRERKARALEQRAEERAAELYAEWQESGLVARNARGKVLDTPAFSRVQVRRETDRETSFDPKHIGQWWLSRAEGERSRFERVHNCLTQTSYLQLTCRHCGEQTTIDAGCGSTWFCHRCRKKNAAKFREKFVRRAAGLMTAARRAGLMSKNFGRHLLSRKRSEWLARVVRQPNGKPVRDPLRFAQRFVTVTGPHWGTVEQRVSIMKLAMPRFADALRAELLVLYPELANYSGITHAKRTRIEPIYRREWNERLRKFEPVIVREECEVPENPRSRYRSEQSLLDCVEYSEQFEWTPGDDGQGHAHWHTWFFSPYLPRELVERVWRASWLRSVEDVAGYCPLELAKHWHGAPLVVDVRAVYRKGDSEANDGEFCDDATAAATELIKYMLKDFELSEDKATRAAPEVFARLYVHASGRRMRQSSAGFGRWALPRVKICETCWHESEVGHWARVEVRHTLQDEALHFVGGIVPPAATGPPDGALTREQQLREAYDARKSAEFGRSFDRRIVERQMRDVLGVDDSQHGAPEERQQSLFRP